MTVKERTTDLRYQVWAEIRTSDTPAGYETEMINSYSNPKTAEHARLVLTNRPGNFVERAWIEDTHV